MAYKALTIGVNTLGLKYCASDANRLAERLEGYGYKTLCPNHGKRALEEAFDTFIDEADNIDTLVLYLAGHGLQEKGKLWLFLADDANKLSNKLNINSWLDDFANCRATNKLVILDCCRAIQGVADLTLV